MRKRFSDEQLDKLAQDVTNELWAVTLRRTYATPGEKKRAIKREILQQLHYVNNPNQEYCVNESRTHRPIL